MGENSAAPAVVETSVALWRSRRTFGQEPDPGTICEFGGRRRSIDYRRLGVARRAFGLLQPCRYRAGSTAVFGRADYVRGFVDGRSGRYDAGRDVCRKTCDESLE